MVAKRIKGRDATITILDADGKTKHGPYRVEDLYQTPYFESTDAQFAEKLGKDFMMEDYEEEAARRGVTLKELFALVIREALEPIE